MRNIFTSRKVLLSALLLIGLAGSRLNAQNSEWRIDTVDSAAAGHFSSLKIDKDGNAHVAYTTDEDGTPLKYSFWDHRLDRWFTMVVDHGASFTSLVLDSKQHPHISYADAGGSKGAKLRYAYWDGTTWKKMPIPLSAEVIGYYTGIALDAS